MDDIVTEELGSILRVQLNRPTKRNAMTSAMYVALARIFNQAANDENIQVVLGLSAETKLPLSAQQLPSHGKRLQAAGRILGLNEQVRSESSSHRNVEGDERSNQDMPVESGGNS